MTNDEIVRVLAQTRTQVNAIRMVVCGIDDYSPIWNDELASSIQRDDTETLLAKVRDGLNDLIRNLGGSVR